MDGADAGTGEHGNRRLGNHRQVNGDAIAFLDAARLQHIGEAAYFGMQLLIGKLFVVLRIVALPQDGRLVTALGKMAVDAVVADVQCAVLEPFDRHVAGVIGGVLDLAEGLDPVEALGLLTPETVRILDRARVHFLVLGFVHVGAFPPIGRNVIDLVRHRASSRPTHYTEGTLFVSAFWPYYAMVPARRTRRGFPLLSRHFPGPYGPHQPTMAPMMTKAPSQPTLSMTVSMTRRP